MQVYILTLHDDAGEDTYWLQGVWRSAAQAIAAAEALIKNWHVDGASWHQYESAIQEHAWTRTDQYCWRRNALRLSINVTNLKPGEFIKAIHI